MKKCIGLLIVGVLLSFSVAEAQDLKGKFNISPSAGTGIPAGIFQADLLPDAGVYRKMGFIFGVNAEYFFTPTIGVGAHFKYAGFGAKDVLGVPMDDKFNVFMIGAHVKYMALAGSRIRPFGTVGFGIAKPTWKDYRILGIPVPLELDIKSRPYISGALGVTYFASPRISVFAEMGGYFMFFDDSKATYSYLLESEELLFGHLVTFVDIRAGINIWFGLKD